MGYNNIGKLISTFAKKSIVATTKELDELVNIKMTKDVFKGFRQPNRTMKCDGMTLWGAKNGPLVHEHTNEILAEALARPKNKKVELHSVPTKKYIDEMLDVAKAERVTEIAKDGYGYVNPKRVMDAKWAFEHPDIATARPVNIESKPISQFIEETFDFAKADDYARLETFGSAAMTKQIAERRADSVFAFTGRDLLQQRPEKAVKAANEVGIKLKDMSTKEIKEATRKIANKFSSHPKVISENVAYEAKKYTSELEHLLKKAKSLGIDIDKYIKK